ncbi:MAG: hypothetical protein LBG06_08605 [Deltaproteobacteria bacterium]|nr:hypothetical protein [Deltaproteobacteria bacterium]
MGYDDTRLALFHKCEQLRGKPLIAYVTSVRPYASISMALDAVLPIITQVQSIPKAEKNVDFLIISNGGDSITALRIIDILRARFDNISVLVPYSAFSAATFLALGANEIVMHPYSNLGPVDPQISTRKLNKYGKPESLHFTSEDIRLYFDFIRSDVGITDQAYVSSALGFLAREVAPLAIGASKRFQQHSYSLCVKMLETDRKLSKEKAESIANALNTAYYHHGYAISRSEARDIGLPIADENHDLETVMWDIWLDYCNEMKCDKDFDIVQELMANDQARQFISNLPIVNLPANTPPEIAHHIIADVAKLNSTPAPQSTVECALLVGAIESSRLAYSFDIKHYIAYWRNANMALEFNITTHSCGWALKDKAADNTLVA